jgi:hypothetical protein
MAKAKDEVKATVTTPAETPAPSTTPPPTPAAEAVRPSGESAPAAGSPPQTTADQEMREWCFHALWCSWRTTVGATKADIGKNMPRLRAWIGDARAEELERQWRGWK